MDSDNCKPLVGVIGGSGLYKIDGVETVDTLNIDTPWGSPSSPITLARLPTGPLIAFLARHSLSHQLTPSEVPSRANIAALKHIGCKVIISFSAVGSLREEIKPRDLVIPDQIIDRTKSNRPSTFFDGLGVVAHVPFGNPFDETLSTVVKDVIRKTIDSFEAEDRIGLHDDKVVVCMEGPAFSTRAESNMYRLIGGDIINMSVLPEAKLAREAEMSYCLIAQITDYDAWRVSEEPVTVAEVMATIAANVSVVNRLSLILLDKVHNSVVKGECGPVVGAMNPNVMTRKEQISEDSKKKLNFILPKLFE